MDACITRSKKLSDMVRFVSEEKLMFKTIKEELAKNRKREKKGK